MNDVHNEQEKYKIASTLVLIWLDEDGNKTETWLYGDKTTCEAAGVCESPEEKGVSRSDRKVGGISFKYSGYVQDAPSPKTRYILWLRSSW